MKIATALLVCAVASAGSASWPQFGRDPQHTGSTPVTAQSISKVLAQIVIDPFVSDEVSPGGSLFVHYAAPLIDGNDLFVELKSGTPGGCRSGAIRGVDPADNTRGAGRVIDDSSSSPAIAPDGSIFYGAYTRYNYSQGHMMHFSASGAFLNAYRFGWDITPAIYAHSGTYSLVTKENHYDTPGSYCDYLSICPNVRSADDPQGYSSFSSTRR